MRRSIALALLLSVGCTPDGGADRATTAATPVRTVLPARVRRLTNAEYDASVWALLGAEAVAEVNGFPRDSTQKLGFTVNDAQIVSPVLAGLLDNAAESVVGGARQSGWLATLAPCADPATQPEQCALEFIGAFAAKAYRRSLTPDDVQPLLAVFRAGASDGGTYEQGVGLVARAILQAPSFLYVTELGDGAASAPSEELTLTLNETASLLAFSTTESPPERALLEDLGSLSTADGREQQARRLLATSAGRKRMVRFVREWLGIDGVAELGKDSNVYPSFASHRSAIAAESSSFIDDVLANGAGTLQELLRRRLDRRLPGQRRDGPGNQRLLRHLLRARFIRRGSYLARSARAAVHGSILKPTGVFSAISRVRHRIQPRSTRRGATAKADAHRPPEPRRAGHRRHPCPSLIRVRPKPRASSIPSMSSDRPARGATRLSTTSASRSKRSTGPAPSARTAKRRSGRPRASRCCRSRLRRSSPAPAPIWTATTPTAMLSPALCRTAK